MEAGADRSWSHPGDVVLLPLGVRARAASPRASSRTQWAPSPRNRLHQVVEGVRRHRKGVVSAFREAVRGGALRGAVGLPGAGAGVPEGAPAVSACCPG